MKKTSILFLLLICLSCARLPEGPEGTRLSLKSFIKNNTVYYEMIISGTLVNINSNTAFLDLKGELTLKEKGKKPVKTKFTSLPFEVKTILPFEKYPLELKITGTGDELKPVFEIFEIDPDRAAQSETGIEKYIGDDFIEMRIQSYSKKNIQRLLRESKNEKI